MPRITYTPGDTPYVIEWEWDDLDSTYAMRIEKMTGLNFLTEVPEAFVKGNVTVLHAVLHTLCKRQGIIPANTPPEGFVFKKSEVSAPDLTTAEAQSFYDTMRDETDLEPDVAEALTVIAARPDVVTEPTSGPESDEDPKA